MSSDSRGWGHLLSLILATEVVKPATHHDCSRNAKIKKMKTAQPR